MANALYDKGREGFLDGSIDWDTDDIRCVAVRTGYTFSAAHDFIDDITTALENGRTAAFGSKTVTSGVADAADTTLTTTAAVQIIALAIFKHTGSDATARLIAYIDTATGLPFTPSASQVVNITWDNTGNRIFKL